MKRFYRSSARCALAFALALWLSVGCALAAENNNLSFWIREDGVETPYYQSMTSAGNALYMLSQDKIYRFLPGEKEPSVFLEGLDTSQWGGYSVSSSDINVTALFAMDGRLYGFGMLNGAVTRLTDESGAAATETVCTVDVSVFSDGNSYVSQVFCADGKLYLLAESQTVALYEYSLTEGASPVAKNTENIVSFAPYKSGFLAGITQPYIDEKEPAAQLVSYDLATGAKETLCSTGISDYAFGIAYDAAKDVLYYGMDCRIYGCSADRAPYTAAYLPERGSALLLMEESGLLVTRAFAGTYLRSVTAGDVSQQVLTVSGEYGSAEHMAVVREHPEMIISPSSAYMGDIQALTTAMVSGESSMDVLRLSLEYQPVESLIDKGYAADLSAYPEIMAIADQMDPRFLKPFQRDGGLYALPVGMNVQTVSVNRQAWTEELGLSLDDLPKTYMELLDFIGNFSYDYGDDHPDIALTDCWDLRADLLSLLLQSEAVYQTAENAGRLSFDNPRFHQLIKALDSIDYSDISLSQVLGTNASEDDYSDFYSKKQLFSLYYGISGPRSCSADNEVVPLVLALDDGLEPVLPASLDVLLLNPKSAHPDLAVAYIAAYASHLNAEAANVTLFPDNNDSVPNPSYETSLRDIQKWLSDRQTALDNAAPEKRAELEEEIKWAKIALEDAEKARFLATAEDIAAYRETISPYLTPLSSNAAIATGKGETDTSIRTLINQYTEKAIDVDTFIRELNNRVRLKILENQ